MKKYVVILVLLLSFINAANAETQPSVTVLVTDNFTHQTLLDKNVSFDKKQNVIDLLRQQAPIKTAFGGAFVTAISGVELTNSPQGKEDWFYYINGIFSRVGGLNYVPKDGDMIWWDHHRWENAAYVASVIGAYPNPFKSGYQGVVAPTTIVTTASFNNKAIALKDSLNGQGVHDVTVVPFAKNITELNSKYVIVVGTWQEIKDDPKVMDLFKNSQKTGAFVRFSQQGISSLDIEGKATDAYPQGACILALGGSFDDNLPVWLVTGTDENIVNQALDILINKPTSIRSYAGVVVTTKGLIHVPVIKQKK